MRDRPASDLAMAGVVAACAHDRQTDKAGQPYLLHPMAVARRVGLAGGSESAVVAAVLHDVIEDCELTAEDLATEFPADVVAIVEAVTRQDDEPYDVFLDRVIAAGPDAMLVKLCDIEDNMDPIRVAALRADQAKSLNRKYAPAVVRLRAALNDIAGQSDSIERDTRPKGPTADHRGGPFPLIRNRG